MPITLAHPVAVLPLRRLGLPMTALVIGTMVPDIPVVLRTPGSYLLTHSLLGILVIDLVIGMAALAVWFGLARDAMVDLAPEAIRSRLAPHVSPGTREWLLAIPAVSIGSATHVVWDSFTHGGNWGVRHLSWLQTEHAGLLGYRWAQYVSGVVGMILIAVAIVQHLRSLPVLRASRPDRVLPRAVLAGVVTFATVVGLASALRKIPVGFHSMAFNGVVNALLAGVVGVTCATVAWKVASRMPVDRH